MHELMVHSAQPSLDDEVSTTAAPTMCARLGLCVCDGLGLKSLRYHRKLVFSIKRDFTPQRQRRKKQADGSFKAIDFSPEQKEKQPILAAHRRLLSFV